MNIPLKYMYECETCGYKTNRRNVLERHHNRKTPCDRKTKLEKETESTTPTSDDTCCKTCTKHLSNLFSLKRHQKICKGTHSLCCEVCKKEFKNRKQKHKHKLSCTMQHKNKELRSFGDETFDHVYNDKNIIQKLKQYGKDGIYGMAKLVADIHFKTPKRCNMNIIKPNEYGKCMLIWGEDKEWEYREFGDIRDYFVRSIGIYVDAYNQMKNKLNIKLIEKKERNVIKQLCEHLLMFEGTVPIDLYEELELCRSEVLTKSMSKNDEKAIHSKFDQSLMRCIYNRTLIHYTKLNGMYILKPRH